MKRTGGGGSVADVHQAHPRLLADLEGEGDARHDRHHVAQVGDLADEPPGDVTHVDVELAAPRQAVTLGHVLPQHFDGRGPVHQHGAEVADQRREDVAPRPVEGERGAHRVRLLAERAEQPAVQLGLTVQRDEALLERPRERHVVVKREQLIARQAAGCGNGSRERR